MHHPFARFAFAAALLLVAALLPRGATASTVLTGGNLVNQTWTPAGSPYVIEGDVTVPAGSTLTIQAGTDVQFVNGDMQAAGLDTSRIEVTINGALSIAGTTASPVTFEMQQGQNQSWYGLVINAGAAAATITGASFAGFNGQAITSAMTGATLSVTRTTIRGGGNLGIVTTNGSATFDQLIIEPATGASNMTGGLQFNAVTANAYQINMTNVLLVDTLYGIYVAGTLTVNVSSVTIDHPEYGVWVNPAGAVVTVANAIITNASSGGISGAVGGTTNVSYSDIWNSGTSTNRVNTGAGMLSANPQYVASGSEYYQLQPSSVCIDSGGSAGAPNHDLDGTSRPLDGDGINGAQYDMGAYEYNPGGGAGGAGGSSASGAGGGAGAAGATGSGGAGGAAGSGAAGAAGASGAAGTTGAAGANGTGGTAGATGAAGAGSTGNGGASGGGGGGAAASGGAGGEASGGAGGGAVGAGGATGGAGASGTGGALAGTGGAPAGTAGHPGSGGASNGTGGAAAGGASGATGGGSGGGCSCQTIGRPASPWGLVLIGAALVFRRRRRDGRA